jgi:hypothetical protein
MGDHIAEFLPEELCLAVERTAFAMAKVGAGIGRPESAIAQALSRRQAVRSIGGGEASLRALLLADRTEAFRDVNRFSDALSTERPADGESAEWLLELAESIGLAEAIRPAAKGILNEALSPDRRRPVLMRAALSAGAIASGSPGSREALAAATLCSERILMAGEITQSPWAAPTQLDAATRASAVQLERTGDWMEWTRAWCVLVGREAAATEKTLSATRERMSRESESVRGQHRVGATDAVVLARLHAVSVFTIRDAVGALELSAPTVGTSIERLEAMGFALELTGQSRDRIWTSTALLGLSLTR